MNIFETNIIIYWKHKEPEIISGKNLSHALKSHGYKESDKKNIDHYETYNNYITAKRKWKQYLKK